MMSKEKSTLNLSETNVKKLIQFSKIGAFCLLDLVTKFEIIEHILAHLLTIAHGRGTDYIFLTFLVYVTEIITETTLYYGYWFKNNYLLGTIFSLLTSIVFFNMKKTNETLKNFNDQIPVIIKNVSSIVSYLCTPTGNLNETILAKFFIYIFSFFVPMQAKKDLLVSYNSSVEQNGSIVKLFEQETLSHEETKFLRQITSSTVQNINAIHKEKFGYFPTPKKFEMYLSFLNELYKNNLTQAPFSMSPSSGVRKRSGSVSAQLLLKGGYGECVTYIMLFFVLCVLYLAAFYNIRELYKGFNNLIKNNKIDEMFVNAYTYAKDFFKQFWALVPSLEETLKYFDLTEYTEWLKKYFVYIGIFINAIQKYLGKEYNYLLESISPINVSPTSNVSEPPKTVQEKKSWLALLVTSWNKHWENKQRIRDVVSKAAERGAARAHEAFDETSILSRLINSQFFLTIFELFIKCAFTIGMKILPLLFCFVIALLKYTFLALFAPLIWLFQMIYSNCFKNEKMKPQQIDNIVKPIEEKLVVLQQEIQKSSELQEVQAKIAKIIEPQAPIIELTTAILVDSRNPKISFGEHVKDDFEKFMKNLDTLAKKQQAKISPYVNNEYTKNAELIEKEFREEEARLKKEQEA